MPRDERRAHQFRSAHRVSYCGTRRREEGLAEAFCRDMLRVLYHIHSTLQVHVERNNMQPAAMGAALGDIPGGGLQESKFAVHMVRSSGTYLRGVLRGAFQTACGGHCVRDDAADRAYFHEARDTGAARVLPRDDRRVHRRALLQEAYSTAGVERKRQRQHHGKRIRPRSRAV